MKDVVLQERKAESIRTERKLNLVLQIIFVVLGLIFFNLWSYNNFFRIDLSKDKIFSLEKTTRALVWKLDKPLSVKVFFTKGLEAPYNNHEMLVLDKLSELQAYSRGQMHIEVIDPTGKAALEQKAKRFGVESVPYRFRSRNRQELKQVYMGVALLYGEKQEVLPVVSNLELLEYDLARALTALTVSSNTPILAFSSGHNEPDLLNGKGPLELMRSKLEERFRLIEQPLGGAGTISEEIEQLWIVGPQKPFSQRALYQIDQFLMRGGSLGVFLTHTRANMRTLRPEEVFHGLDAFLGHYGVFIQRDLIADRKQNGVMSFPVHQGNSQRMIPLSYPLLPRVTSLKHEHIVMRGIDELLFPFVSSLELSNERSSSVSAQVWAKTSSASGRIASVRSIDPTAYKVLAPGEERGEWPVLIALEGRMSSFFADKTVPEPPIEEQGTKIEEPKLVNGVPARLIVAGSADFVPNNVAFMLNLADWMSQSDNLIRIRAKAMQLAPLTISDAELWKLRLFNLVGGLAILWLVGGFVFIFKRRL